MKRNLSNRIFSAVALIAAIGFSGCVNMSALQTARALPTGEGRILIGGGYYKETGDSDLTAPYGEFGYRRGIIDNLELGAKLTLPGTFALDGKYQFVDMGPFAMAAGLGAGYVNVTSGSGDTEISSHYIDLTVPVFASIHVSEWFAFYVSPKYNLRLISGDASGTGHLLGGTGGVRIGSGIGFFAECSYLMDLESDFDMLQIAGAFYF